MSEIDFDNKCRDKILMHFLSQILNEMGVISSGKVIRKVQRMIDGEEDLAEKSKMEDLLQQLKTIYMSS